MVFAWILGCSTLVACSSDDAGGDIDTADVYAAVIEWFIDDVAADQDRPVVFLTSLGEGLGVGLDTQAAVIAATEPFADARFVDDWSEALGDDGVRQDGIFLALGPVVQAGARVHVECDRVRSENVRVRRTFELGLREGAWEVIGEPKRS